MLSGHCMVNKLAQISINKILKVSRSSNRKATEFIGDLSLILSHSSLDLKNYRSKKVHQNNRCYTHVIHRTFLHNSCCREIVQFEGKAAFHSSVLETVLRSSVKIKVYRPLIARFSIGIICFSPTDLTRTSKIGTSKVALIPVAIHVLI